MLGASGDTSSWIGAKGKFERDVYTVFVDPKTITPNILKNEFWRRIQLHTAYPADAVTRLEVRYQLDGDLCLLGDEVAELRELDLRTTKFIISIREFDEDNDTRSFEPGPLTRKDDHEIFLSYRVRYNLSHVRLLRDSIERQANIHVFLDKECLIDGLPWTEGFIQGLLRSNIFVPICSRAALERMELAHTEIDNQLLEWEIALDMYHEATHRDPADINNRPKLRIFPILLADTDNTSFTVDMNRFPQQYPYSPSSRRKYTVQQIIHGILQFQGRETLPSTMRDVIPDILQCVNATHQPLLRDDLAPLFDWLNPVDTKDDRIRISREHIEGTRDWLLKRVRRWVESDENTVLWLKGVAGAGKSVMAAFAARHLEQYNLLGASFFCKHGDQNRNDAGRLINSIAYSLAAWHPEFGTALLKVLKEHDWAATSSVHSRFEKLLREPLQRVQAHLGKVVLIFDALDECVGHERSQLLDIIANSFHTLPACVKVFVTARPDPDIVAAFATVQCEAMIPSSKENLDDIRHYAWSRLSRTNYTNAQLEGMLHKIEALTNQLVDSSGGLFIWTKLALDMIGRERTLQDSLEMVHELSIDTGDLYIRVFDAALRDYPGPTLPMMMQAIITVIEPLSLEALGGLIGLSSSQASEAYASLEAVLITSNGKVRLLHKSVADFLVQESNQYNPFHVDLTISHAQVAIWCLEAITTPNVLRPNICDLDPRLLNTEQNIEQRIAEKIPQHVQYACKSWMKHTTYMKTGFRYRPNEGLAKLVDVLYQETLILWLEVLGLLNALATVINGTKVLWKWWEVQHSDAQQILTASLMYDSVRFVNESKVPLTQRTAHLYLSCLPFAPSGTALHSQYVEQLFPRPQVDDNDNRLTIPTIRSPESDWPNCLMTMNHEGKGAGNIEVCAVSSDCNRILVRYRFRDREDPLVVWDGERGEQIGYLGDDISDPCISGDGKWAMASVGAVTKVWDLTTFKCHVELPTGCGDVKTNHDGRYVVSSSNRWNPDAIVTLWDISKRVVLNTFGKGYSALNDVGTHVVTLHEGIIRIWDSASAKILCEFRDDEHPFASFRVLNNGSTLTISTDKVVKLWDKGGSVLGSFMDTAGITQAEISGDGSRLVTFSKPDGVKTWDVETGRAVHTLGNRKECVYFLAISHDGNGILTQEDMKVLIWSGSAATGFEKASGPIATTNRLKPSIKSYALSMDGGSIVVGYSDWVAEVWKETQPKSVIKLAKHNGDVLSVAISETGSTVATASAESINISSGLTGQLIHSLKARVAGIRINRDGSLIAGFLHDEVHIWKFGSTGLQHEVFNLELNSFSRGINDLAISNNGYVLIIKDGKWRSSSLWTRNRFRSNFREVKSKERNGRTFEEHAAEYGCYNVPTKWAEVEDGWVRADRGDVIGWLPLAYRDSKVAIARSLVIVCRANGHKVAIRGWIPDREG
ncbi:hypothetical protein HDV00_007229 [Rhizophlyctis rosea]|nr:hypothetical protein HDV00_007229 [Rhizophlyctis rosea]